MAHLQIELPPKLIPVFDGDARYRGAYGGRGSGKTRTFAKMAAVRGLMFAKAGIEGIILCGREFMNSLDESSMAEVKAAIASEPWLRDNYDVGEKYIRTNDRRVEFKFAGLRHNLDSIKSKARILICWVDEAEPVTEAAWVKLIPTVREHSSEIWVTWNPERKSSATHKRFRESPPDGAKIVRMNWSDNPWFPDVLNQERLNDEKDRPDQYDHIWEGDFATVVDGAYYAPLLSKARKEKRIGVVAADPLLSIKSYHDIGGAGRNADAYTIWIWQIVGQEIRILDYYEAVGQVLASHVGWMRDSGWGHAEVILPHDGTNTNNVTGKRYEDHWREASFTVRTVANQGKGAAKQRIEATRRLFPQMWFNEETTEAGREALGFYHEKIDEQRNVGLGPEHDWASHAADAFGLGAIDYTPSTGGADKQKIAKLLGGSGRSSGWMAN